MQCFGNITENKVNNSIKNMLVRFENKLSNLWQLDGQLHECEDENRAYRLELRQRQVQKEVDQARTELVAAIEALEARAVEDSWAANPDRMGGQFTQDEIQEAQRGGHGW